MNAEMRRALAQESFEEKIRKVGQLIRLSATVKSTRIREMGDDIDDGRSPASPMEETRDN